LSCYRSLERVDSTAACLIEGEAIWVSFVPTAITCQLQTQQPSFGIVLAGGQAIEVAVADRSVVGIRIETPIPPPSC
jgi:hypothetical protein